jgi:hypothetical protein
MKLFLRPPSLDTTASASLGTQFGWKVHAALNEWTARADAKASFFFTIEAASLGFVITLSTGDRVFSHVHGYQFALLIIGLTALGAGMVFAALAVTPRLNRASTRATWRDNIVYFGHLRYWEPTELAHKLAALNEETELRILGRELVIIAKFAWRKYSCLQASMLLAFGGILALSL